MAVGRAHHGDVGECRRARRSVDQLALDRLSALDLEAELLEERDGGVEVVDDDADVVDALERRQSTYWSGVTAKPSGSVTPVAWFGQ